MTHTNKVGPVTIELVKDRLHSDAWDDPFSGEDLLFRETGINCFVFSKGKNQVDDSSRYLKQTNALRSDDDGIRISTVLSN